MAAFDEENDPTTAGMVFGGSGVDIARALNALWDSVQGNPRSTLPPTLQPFMQQRAAAPGDYGSAWPPSSGETITAADFPFGRVAPAFNQNGVPIGAADPVTGANLGPVSPPSSGGFHNVYPPSPGQALPGDLLPGGAPLLSGLAGVDPAVGSRTPDSGAVLLPFAQLAASQQQNAVPLSGDSDIPRDASPPPPIDASPPAYRSGNLNADDWANYRSAAGASGRSANQQYALSQIFSAEGGMTPDTTGNGLTIGGITPGTLADLKKYYPDENLSTPGDVFNAEAHSLDRSFHTIGGASALDQIDDRNSAAAFADTVFRNGSSGGTKMIQEATNRTIGSLSPDEIDRMGLRPLDVDGRMGPATLDVFAKLSNNGYGFQLRDELANVRAYKYENAQRALNGQPPIPVQSGDLVRYQHFR